MSRIIREAIPTDIPEIMKVVDAAKIIMRQSGNMHQWGEGYPSEEFCFSHDTNIRIDTHHDNKIMQHNIQKHGFTYCGIIYLLSGDERMAYQKTMVNTNRR